MTSRTEESRFGNISLYTISLKPLDSHFKVLFYFVLFGSESPQAGGREGKEICKASFKVLK